MGALTEVEIFDCMLTNLRLAAEHCEDLAVLPRKGPTYTKLRDELQMIEGACRQASAWREDTRWLPLAGKMAQAHKLAGDWLRGLKGPGGVRVKIAAGHMHPLFLMLADKLRQAVTMVEHVRNSATGHLGMILPTPLPGPHRETRPVTVHLPYGMRTTPAGIILPGTATVQ